MRMNTVNRKSAGGAMMLSWAEICNQYPNEWVCLFDISRGIDGAIQSAQVVSHDRSMEHALDQASAVGGDLTVVHTAGHPMWTPWIEVVDENRDPFRISR